jgi:hypothetical protein
LGFSTAQHIASCRCLTCRRRRTAKCLKRRRALKRTRASGRRSTLGSGAHDFRCMLVLAHLVFPNLFLEERLERLPVLCRPCCSPFLPAPVTNPLADYCISPRRHHRDVNSVSPIVQFNGGDRLRMAARETRSLQGERGRYSLCIEVSEFSSCRLCLRPVVWIDWPSLLGICALLGGLPVRAGQSWATSFHSFVPLVFRSRSEQTQIQSLLHQAKVFKLEWGAVCCLTSLATVFVLLLFCSCCLACRADAWCGAQRCALG